MFINTLQDSNSLITSLAVKETDLPAHILAAANEISQLDGVGQIVLLPDVHLKQKYIQAGYKIAIPSSAAIITESQKLYPQFRSRGIGCGMILIATGLMVEDLSLGADWFTKNLPRYLTNTKPAHNNGRASFALTEADMIQMCLQGASWVCEQFRLPIETTHRFWNNGDFFTDAERNNFSWDGFAPSWREGKFRPGQAVGLDLGGNHFLEAQIVQEIPGETDSPLSMKKGELVFLYHGSCNGLEWVLEREIVNRVIRRDNFEQLSPDQIEYHLIMRAVKLLSNWSAAARCLVIARLQGFLKMLFPDMPLKNIRCISEATHNGIFQESYNGQDRLVYRHNGVPIDDGKPAIVSGRYDHNSYLFFAGESIQKSFRTLDHGIGAILQNNQIDRDKNTAGSYRVEQHYLKGFRFRKRTQYAHLLDSTQSMPNFYDHYVREGLVRPNHYAMRPLATLKIAQIPLRRLYTSWTDGARK